MSKKNTLQHLRDIREKMSLEIVDMNLEELQAYLKARGTLKDSLPPRPAKKRARPAVRRRSSAKAR